MSSSMIRVANRPNVDTQGFVNGVLKKVILGEGMRREKKGRNIDETKYDRYEFYFEVEGKSGDPIEIRLYTGTVLNDDPIQILGKNRGKKEQKNLYNRFTVVCTTLKLLSKDDLENMSLSDAQLDDIAKSLKEIHDLPVRVKVGKNSDGFYAIDPDSLTLV